MFYDVLRTWLIAKEIIQRSAKAMRENIGSPQTAEIRSCFTAPFLRSSLQIASDGWVGQSSHPTPPRGLVKESQQGLGREHNLLSGSIKPVQSDSRPSRSGGKVLAV